MATDSFTNTNGTALTTHNSAWVFSAVPTTDDQGRIYNNAVSYSIWSEATYYRNDSNGNESEIVLLSGETGTIAKVRPAVRISAGNAGYAFNLAGTGTNWTTLNYYKNDNYQGEVGSLTYAKASNHTLKIVASGTGSPVTITCYVDGTSVASWQDSTTPYTSGYSGLFLVGDGGNDYGFGDSWTDNAVAAGQPTSKRLGGIPFASQTNYSQYRW